MAFEMALTLQAKGIKINSLTLIDSEAPGNNNGRFYKEEYTDIEILAQMVELFELSAGCSFDLTADDFVSLDASGQLSLLHHHLRLHQLLPTGSSPEALKGVVSTFGANLRTHYHPKESYQAPVQLILALDPKKDRSGNEKYFKETTEGWSQLAPNINIWNVPGNHLSMLQQPHIANIVEMLEIKDTKA